MTDEPRPGGLDPRPDDDWEARLTKQVVRTIAHYKEALGLTTPQLAERYSAAVGEPGALKPTTLNNLLAGKRRSIGFAEILAFARALEVPPLALMVPLFEAGEVEAYPGEPMIPAELHAALVGIDGQAGTGGNPTAEPLLSRIVLAALVMSYSEQTMLLGNLAELAGGETGLPPTAVKGRRDRVLQRAILVRDARADLAKRGVTLPALPPELAWVELLQTTEITDEVINELAQSSAEVRRDASA